MSEPLPPTPDAKDSSRPPVDEGIVHPEVRYEEADVAVSRVVLVLLGIVFVFASVSLISWRFLLWNESDADRAAQAPQFSLPAEGLPAEPRLEPLDRSEMTAASEVFTKQLAMERLLHSYGKAAEDGFVHIPIEQAMKLAAAAVPVRPIADKLPAKSFGLVGGGEPNSGRLYLEAPSWLQQKQ